MLNPDFRLNFFAVALLFCASTTASASPVLYASSGDYGSSGTSQMYVIDPIAATITAVRGPGEGGGGGYAGLWLGGGGGSGGSGGSGSGSPGGSGGSGGSGGGSFGGSGGVGGFSGFGSPGFPFGGSGGSNPLGGSSDPANESAELDCEALRAWPVVLLHPKCRRHGSTPSDSSVDLQVDLPQWPYDEPPRFLPENIVVANDIPTGNNPALTPTAVPEPGSIALLGVALAGLGMMLRGRKA